MTINDKTGHEIEAPELKNPCQRMKILLVDDSDDNLFSVQTALDPLGQEILLASSGKEALRLCLDHDFAAILLDVRMPEMDGFETAEFIRSRQRSKHTPLLFLTAYRSDEQLFRGYDLGAVDFLFRPLVPEILQSKVRVFVELSRTTEALRRANVYNRSLIEASVDPLITIAPDGRIMDVNRAAEQAIGLSRQEIVHTEFCSYFTDPEKAQIGYLRIFQGGWIQDHELDLQHCRGGTHPVICNASVYRDETGKVAGAVAALRDISERKRAEQALSRYADDLKRSNSELEQFAYVASHDLQEPLRAVTTFTQLLADRYRGKMDPDADEFMSLVVDGARRMSALIQDLLAYSRVGRCRRAWAAVDCETVVEAVLSDLSGAIEDTGGTVTHTGLPVVRADETELSQVFLNLIGNALKFHGTEPPQIHVSAQREPREWRISVADNGIGIDSQYADEIFRMFSRLHTSGEFPGTGIGLALAKRIVERRGGRIGVRSEPGRGATFHFTIPDEEPLQIV